MNALHIQKIIVPTLIVLLCLLLTACATVSKNECVYLDWNTRGYMDGLEGKAVSKLQDYQNSCNKYGITIDIKDYSAGRDRGLKMYCTIDHGYKTGSSGTEYHDVCPHNLANDFIKGYNVGIRLYNGRQAVVNAESSISVKKYRINELRREIKKLRKALYEDDLTEESKKTKRRQIDRRQDEIEELWDDISFLQDERLNAIVRYRMIREEITRQGFDTSI